MLVKESYSNRTDDYPIGLAHQLTLVSENCWAYTGFVTEILQFALETARGCSYERLILCHQGRKIGEFFIEDEDTEVSYLSHLTPATATRLTENTILTIPLTHDMFDRIHPELKFAALFKDGAFLDILSTSTPTPNPKRSSQEWRIPLNLQPHPHPQPQTKKPRTQHATQPHRPHIPDQANP